MGGQFSKDATKPQSVRNSSSKKKRNEFSYEIDGDPDQYDEDRDTMISKNIHDIDDDNIIISHPLRNNDFYA